MTQLPLFPMDDKKKSRGGFGRVFVLVNGRPIYPKGEADPIEAARTYLAARKHHPGRKVRMVDQHGRPCLDSIRETMLAVFQEQYGRPFQRPQP